MDETPSLMVKSTVGPDPDSLLTVIHINREPLPPTFDPMTRLSIAFAFAIVCSILASTPQCVADDSVDFSRDIKPLLSSRCFTCHGPDENSREAGLRLDTPDGATEDLGGYQAITPGDLDESELYRRIISDDESEVMPPIEHGEPFTDAEKELLKQWILSGGKYEQHWSYVSPAQPQAPVTADSDWPKSKIDQFVLDRMNRAGLSPSQPASRLAIARRVSLDLTGLPPTIEQADAFANDSDPDAYEKFVDQLLASPAFGEHWAAMWLDLARYADSAGYAEDKIRSIWPYRDYVIRSYQSNKPFDQFTIEQLAGDMLPEPTDDQLIATAFHRNTLTNSEGGTDDEEFRSVAVVDRTNTTMAVWMGTTMACAQCHSHKYDPISQAEYFQVYALLNNTKDNDRPDEQPLFKIYSRKQIDQRAEILQQIETLTADRDIKKNRPAPEIESQHAKEQLAWELVCRDRLSKVPTGRFIRIDLKGKKKILSLAEVQVFSNEKNVARNGTATQSTLDYDGKPEFGIDGNTSGNFDDQSTTHTKISNDPWWQVDLGATVVIDRISVWNRTGGDLPRRLDGFQISILDEDKQPVWSQVFERAAASEQEVFPLAIPLEIVSIIKTPRSERSETESTQLREYFVTHESSEHKTDLLIANDRERLAAINPSSTVPVMRELEPSKRRETRVQIRGSHLNLGDVVQPATPVAFHPIVESEKNRLGFARWLVDRNNPLTARVAVNRFWQQLFGIGLVRTSEDFGAQGDLPSHPQLLDHLAVEFMESNWDVKATLKQIVMSATYRQGSRVTPATRKIDPNNTWFSRGPRFRVSAEIIRDQALFSSGLLSQKMFGPPVQPPGPSLGLKAAFSGEITWITSQGEDRYRRAIYTQWRRSSPYPSMETFDVSNREVCDLRRISTNTPLQALVTLNDPVFVEAAQALARRATSSLSDPREIARQAFRLVLIREPTTEELDELVRLFRETKQHFATHPQQAIQLATDPIHPATEGADMIDLASWTTVANVILNLDEVFSKR